jgi:hypothetical protein
MKRATVALFLAALLWAGVAPAQAGIVTFDTLPGGGPPTAGNLVGASFAPWGVTFSSYGVSDMPIFEELAYGGTSGDFFAVSLHAAYPTWCNIVADFSAPVSGPVSVDVMTAAGRSVTMLVFDANGTQIGSVTSLSAPATFWAGNLSFSSATPIARLEWWSSDQFAAVGIDNLTFGVPDLGSTLLLLGTALAGLGAATRRWR